MRKIIFLLAMACFFSGAFSAACTDTTGMTTGTDFYYSIGIGTGTDPKSYQMTGKGDFLFDIDIRPQAAGGTLIPQIFESEFRYRCQCGFCGTTTSNDVFISNFFADPYYFAPGNGTEVNIEVTNNNPCAVQSLGLALQIVYQDGTTQVNCTGLTPGPIPASTVETFTCTTDVLQNEGRYDMSALLSNVVFGSGTGCIDEPNGNSQAANFVVSRGARGTSMPIPEIGEILVAFVAVIALAVLRRKG